VIERTNQDPQPEILAMSQYQSSTR